jgi:hypothetical protein
MGVGDDASDTMRRSLLERIAVRYRWLWQCKAAELVEQMQQSGKRPLTYPLMMLVF